MQYNVQNVIKFSYGDYIRLHVSKNIIDWLTPFSITMQFSIDQVNRDIVLFEQQGFLKIGIKDKKIYAIYSIDANFIGISNKMTLQEIESGYFYNIAVTFDGSILKLYYTNQVIATENIQALPYINNNDYIIGGTFCGYLQYLRIFEKCLTPDDILYQEYQIDFYYGEGTGMLSDYLVLWVSAELGKISCMNGDIHMEFDGCYATNITPCYRFEQFGSVIPVNDAIVNPGGFCNDCYTVSAVVYFDPIVQFRYSIYTNCDIEKQSGMALYIEYAEDEHYYVYSQRGKDECYEADNRIKSAEPIQANTWTEITTTFDGVYLKLYINGQLSAKEEFIPNPEYQIEGRGIIGDALRNGISNGDINFRGYIKSVYVFRDCLSDEVCRQINGDNAYSFDSLVGAYEILSGQDKNLVNENDLFFSRGVRFQLAEGIYPLKSHLLKRTVKPICPASVTNVFTSKDIIEMKNLWIGFREIWERDYLKFGYTDKESMINNVEEYINSIKEGDFIKYRVRNYIEGDKRHFVYHCPFQGEILVASIDKDEYDDITVWRVTLIMTIFLSMVSVLTGLRASSSTSSRAVIYIAKLLVKPEIKVALAVVLSSTSTSSVIDFFQALYQVGAVKTLLNIFFAISTYAIFCLALKLIAMITGYDIIYIVGAIAIALITIGVIIAQKPDEKLASVAINRIDFKHTPTNYKISSTFIRSDYRMTEEEYEKSNKGKQPAILYIADRITKEAYVNVSFLVQGQPNSVIVKATGGGILGDLEEQEIMKGKMINGQYQFVLKNQQIQSDTLTREEIVWEWQANIDGTGFVPMENTTHKIYIVTSVPCAPIVMQEESCYNPCSMMMNSFYEQWNNVGLTQYDNDQILLSCIKAVYENPVLYYQGDKNYVIYDSLDWTCLNLKKYVTEYKEFFDHDYVYVNCEDCSGLLWWFISVFLPDEAQRFIYVIMNNINKDHREFYYNFISPISNLPKRRNHFNYHAVLAREPVPGAADDDYLIYDACLKYSTADDIYEPDPKTKPTEYPFGHRFSNSGADSQNIGPTYRECFCQKDGDFVYNNNEKIVAECKTNQTDTKITTKKHNFALKDTNEINIIKNLKASYLIKNNQFQHVKRVQTVNNAFKDYYSINNLSVGITYQLFTDEQQAQEEIRETVSNRSFGDLVEIQFGDEAYTIASFAGVSHYIRKENRIISFNLEPESVPLQSLVLTAVRMC